ncbi:MAG: hypothetical protein ACREJY_03220 [Candidatus Rokuibacteriota bacterium]
MKLGCLGCLTVLVVALLVLVLGVGALWVWDSVQASPHLLSARPSKADPAAVERRLAELGSRAGGRSSRGEPLVFSEPEVAAFLARHLDDAGLRLSPVHTRLRTTEITVQGQIPLGALLQGAPFTWLPSVIARRTLDAPVWITLAGTIGLEAASSPRRPRYAEARLIDSQVGRLSIPGWLLTMMAGSRGASLLRWQVPAIVERLEVGDGKLTIRTR